MQQPQPTPTASAGRRSWPTWVNGRGAVWLLLPKCGAAGHGGTDDPCRPLLVMNSRSRPDQTPIVRASSRSNVGPPRGAIRRRPLPTRFWHHHKGC